MKNTRPRFPRKEKKRLKKKGWWISNEDWKLEYEDYISTIKVPVN